MRENVTEREHLVLPVYLNFIISVKNSLLTESKNQYCLVLPI